MNVELVSYRAWCLRQDYGMGTATLMHAALAETYLAQCPEAASTTNARCQLRSARGPLLGTRTRSVADTMARLNAALRMSGYDLQVDVSALRAGWLEWDRAVGTDMPESRDEEEWARGWTSTGRWRTLQRNGSKTAERLDVNGCGGHHRKA